MASIPDYSVRCSKCNSTYRTDEDMVKSEQAYKCASWIHEDGVSSGYGSGYDNSLMKWLSGKIPAGLGVEGNICDSCISHLIKHDVLIFHEQWSMQCKKLRLCGCDECMRELENRDRITDEAGYVSPYCKCDRCRGHLIAYLDAIEESGEIHWMDDFRKTKEDHMRCKHNASCVCFACEKCSVVIFDARPDDKCDHRFNRSEVGLQRCASDTAHRCFACWVAAWNM